MERKISSANKPLSVSGGVGADSDVSELLGEQGRRESCLTRHQSSLFRLYNMAALAKIYLVFYNVTLTLG